MKLLFCFNSAIAMNLQLDWWVIWRDETFPNFTVPSQFPPRFQLHLCHNAWKELTRKVSRILCSFRENVRQIKSNFCFNCKAGLTEKWIRSFIWVTFCCWQCPRNFIEAYLTCISSDNYSLLACQCATTMIRHIWHSISWGNKKNCSSWRNASSYY